MLRDHIREASTEPVNIEMKFRNRAWGERKDEEEFLVSDRRNEIPTLITLFVGDSNEPR